MPKFDNVFLTYANEITPDGAGAQLHRIYGIYCLSRLLGTKYLHSPLNDVYYQGLEAFQNQEKDPTFIDTFNRKFALPSDRTTTAAPILRLAAVAAARSIRTGAWRSIWRAAEAAFADPVLEIRPPGRPVVESQRRNRRSHRRSARADGSLCAGLRGLQIALPVQAAGGGTERSASRCMCAAASSCLSTRSA